MASSASWYREVCKLAAGFNATVKRTPGGHLAIELAGGGTVYAASTPGDTYRGLRNLRTDLRRADRARNGG